jgi:hypothetical protein
MCITDASQTCCVDVEEETDSKLIQSADCPEFSVGVSSAFQTADFWQILIYNPLMYKTIISDFVHLPNLLTMLRFGKAFHFRLQVKTIRQKNQLPWIPWQSYSQSSLLFT